MGVEVEKEALLRKIPGPVSFSSLWAFALPAEHMYSLDGYKHLPKQGCPGHCGPPTWATAIASTTRWRPWFSLADSPNLALPGIQFSASASSSPRWGSFQNWTI